MSIYWKVKMIYWDSNGKRRKYDRFVIGYDRDDAIQNALSERLEDEKDDRIDCVIECTEEEYETGLAKVNDGWRGEM